MTDERSEILERFLSAAVDLLTHGNRLERATAASVLGTIGGEAYVGVLLDALRTDESRQVQHKVSQAIARVGGEEAVNGLQELMREENQYTRFLAAEALADIFSRGNE